MPLSRLLFSSIFLLVAAGPQAATFTIGQGSGFDFQTIGESVEAASNGDVLSVTGGIYDATHGETFPIEISKNLTLRGQTRGLRPEIVGDATHSVLVFDSVDEATLDGLTIRNGRAPRGGGIDVGRSTLSVYDCRILDNTADDSGGGIYSSGSLLALVDCVIAGNKALGQRQLEGTRRGISGGIGGGVRVRDAPSFFLANSTINDNRSGFQGAGVDFEADLPAEVQIVDCTIERNVVDFIPLSSGAVYLEGILNATLERTRVCHNEVLETSSSYLNSGIGGRINPTHLDVRLVDCVIEDNRGMNGVSVTDASLSHCSISGNDSRGVLARRMTLEDCDISQNGGVGVYASESITLRRCAVSGNGHTLSEFLSSQSGGLYVGGTGSIENSRIVANIGNGNGVAGGIQFQGSELRMLNSIVMGNRYEGDSISSTPGILAYFGSLEIVNCVLTENYNLQPDLPLRPAREGLRDIGSTDLTLSNSIVWEATHPFFGVQSPDKVQYCNVSIPVVGEGNISSDPLFLKPWDGANANLRLPCNSPCVDAGTLEGAPFTDIEGTRRPRGAGVDLGAYENCALDLTGDGVENGIDLLFFPSEWFEPVNETNFLFDFVTGPSATPRVDNFDLVEILNRVPLN